LSLSEVVERVREGKEDPEERVERYLEAIREKNPELNAFTYVEEDPDVPEEPEGELAGVVVGVKANINVEGMPCDCASRTLEGYVAPYDATVVRRLKEAGAVVIGITNMDEFAAGSSGETSCHGPTDNPRAPGRIPGGSSSGSAAAVAAGLCDVALGSDTGGSIRNPASHCGVVGFKPTYGLVPRQGLVDLAMSFDQIGPLAGSVEDAALVLQVIAGPGPDVEPTVRDQGVPRYHDLLDPGEVEGYTVGLVREFLEVSEPGIAEVAEDAARRLERVGAEVVEVEVGRRLVDVALPTYYVINYVEFFSATRRFDGRRYGRRIEHVCGREVLRRIVAGAAISREEVRGQYYERALRVRTWIRRRLMEALEDVDVLLGPTVPKPPHRIGEELSVREMYGYDVLTVIPNLAGAPAGTVPFDTVEVEGDEVPCGVQVIGAPWEDLKVLNVMAALEEVAPFDMG